MDKIDRAMLLKMMDDDQDQETQNQAVDLAKKDENIEFWIQPDGYKYSWDNCARVIIEKKDKELAPYMSLLLKWLQDLNWPGALLVLERLKHVEPKFIIRDLEKTINEATQNNDLSWIEFLSELTESKTILEGLDENVKKTLLDLKSY